MTVRVSSTVRVFFAVLGTRVARGFLAGGAACSSAGGCSATAADCSAAGVAGAAATVSDCSDSVSVDKIHSLSRRLVNPVN
ncbi:hypothetical protein Acsp05_09640 [Actinokineospora sp. NBRC 105648]|nr:hypothetical protein Acsp05_09640 [Actinokineospora sp. NBRC 105648]